MKKSNVIINFVSLTAFILYFELSRLNKWNPQLLVYETIPFLILLITYVKVIKSSGVRALTHKKYKSLNGQGLSVDLKAVKLSYSLFTIITSVILLTYVLFKIELNIVSVTGLIYLAHILPSYSFIWKSTSTKSTKSQFYIPTRH